MSDDPEWIDELYAEGANELPPPELDEKIRSAARQPTRHPWHRNPGRLAALATAASLVIAVSVIYFEPDQQSLQTPAADAMSKSENIQGFEARPAEIGESELRFEQDQPANAPGRSVSKPVETPDTSSADLAERKSTRAATPNSAQAAEEMAVQETATPGMRAMTELGEPADVQLARVGSEGAIADREWTAAKLAERCGPLPGKDETRTIVTEGSEWHVAVTIGNDVQRWRCVDGAWIEFSSEQQ